MFDAVIVGAGPAGSGLARALALSGWKVFLADKDHPGAKKVCGGFLGPESLAPLKVLGLSDDFREFSANPITQADISGPDGRSMRTHLGVVGGYAVDRQKFDSWLFEKAAHAGAVVSPQTCMERADKVKDGWQCSFTKPSGPSLSVSARVLIYANGRRNGMSSVRSSRKRFFACRTIYEGVSAGEHAVSLYFVRKGHVGFNPLGNGRSMMCFYVSEDALKSCKGDLDRVMQNFKQENPSIERYLCGASRADKWSVCAAASDGQNIFYRNDAFYVGDAVTMVNPIIGGGMSVALGSAVLLSQCLLRGQTAGKNPVQIGHEYERVWKRQYQTKVLFGRLLGFAEQSHRFSRVIFSTLQQAPPLFKSLVKNARPIANFHTA